MAEEKQGQEEEGERQEQGEPRARQEQAQTPPIKFYKFSHMFERDKKYILPSEEEKEVHKQE